MILLSFPQAVEDDRLQFAVIAARCDSKWVFCKHRERDTWEIPGGHREPGEAISDTARRELWEETGAEDYTLTPIGPYGVDRDGNVSYGMLYYAEITRLGPLPKLEMERVELMDKLPERWTYPDLQPRMLALVKESVIV